MVDQPDEAALSKSLHKFRAELNPFRRFGLVIDREIERLEHALNETVEYMIYKFNVRSVLCRETDGP